MTQTIKPWAKGVCALLTSLMICNSSPIFLDYAHAQTTSDTNNPFSAEINESINDPSTAPATDEDKLQYALSVLKNEGDKLQATYGMIDDKGVYQPGALNGLKLKPSDKKRLLKIMNGSLSDAQKKRTPYDQRSLDLLISLTKPKDLGGGGFTHLRVGDFLRFKNDPRSKETENTDNISQHQFGKATDILEINTARCTKKSLAGGSKKLAPFPVKVLWQGGAPPNPSVETLGSFDAIARANAFRDILGALPGDSYSGSVQGFTDLLQQLQRRVIAQEIGLPSGGLDYVTDNDLLTTMGRVSVAKAFGFAPGAFLGTNQEDILRSIPRAALEQSFQLPPTSLKGDDWNQSFERLGRMTIAYQLDIDPQEVLSGKVDKIAASPYLKDYKGTVGDQPFAWITGTYGLDPKTAQSELAFRLAPNTIKGIESNNPAAFRKIGAQIIADHLNYSADELKTLLGQAESNSVTQLSLARFGPISDFPGPILPLIAPAADSSKAKGESYLAGEILKGTNQISFDGLPETIHDGLKTYLPIYKSVKTRKDMTLWLASLSPDAANKVYRYIGARYMEQIFDLPDTSLAKAIQKHGTPTLAQFKPILEQRLKEDDADNGGISNLGQNYMDQNLRDSFSDVYMIPTHGPVSLTVDEMYSLLLGQNNQAAARVGASWVEEDLGLVPNSFTIFFADGPQGKQYTSEDKLVYAGLSVIGGELFDAFDITTPPDQIKLGPDFELAIGQARIETTLGLIPGSFRDSWATIQKENQDRAATIFTSNDGVDTTLGLTPGTTEKLKKNQTTPKDIAIQVGKEDLAQLKGDDFETRLGIDSAYTIDGDQIARTVASKDGTDKVEGSGPDSGKKISLRGLLATVGSYNSDSYFGYGKSTISRWVSAKTPAEGNSFLRNEGAKLYSDRLGISKFSDEDDTRSNLLTSYTTGSSGARQYVVDKMKQRLEGKRENLEEDILNSALNEVGDQIDNVIAEIEAIQAPTPAVQAAIDKALTTLRQARDRIVVNEQTTDLPPTPENATPPISPTNDQPKPTQASVKDIIESVKNDVNTALNQVGKDNLFSDTRDTLNDLTQNMADELAKLTGLPDITIIVPIEDVQSFINGHMKLATAVLAAAVQAKQVVIEAQDIYKLMRTIVAGWSSDPEFEKTLFKDISTRYGKVLEEHGRLKAINGIGSLLDRADIIPNEDFRQIITGKLSGDGSFATEDSPYDQTTKDKISFGFLLNKEARNNFYYGILDYQAKKLLENNIKLPKDFSKVIMEGSNKDRAEMLYSYLGTQLGAKLLSTLPPELRKKVADYAANRDSLEGNPDFNSWANDVLSMIMKQQDENLPENIGQIIRQGTDDERLGAAYVYLKSKIGQGIVSSLPPQLQSIATTYINNYDPATGKVKNPNYKPGDGSDEYLTVDKTIDDWAKGTFAQYISKIPNPVLSASASNIGNVLYKGSDEDRRNLAMSVIQSKLQDVIGSLIPTKIKDIAQQFLSIDPVNGKIGLNENASQALKNIADTLSNSESFAFWAGTMLGQFIGSKLPKGVVKIAIDYLSGKVTPQSLVATANNRITETINNFIGLGKDKIVGMVGHALGLPVGTMKSFYDKYKQAKSVYSSLKAGKLDTFGAVLALDGILLDGALTKLVGKLDDILHLPAGSTQSLLFFAITGNPIFLAQFFYSLFFTAKVKCPNLQKEAKKNIKSLLSTVMDLGRDDKSIVPSQIVAFDKSYINELMDKVKRNYANCIDGARCGVFASPEYARQVHIGF